MSTSTQENSQNNPIEEESTPVENTDSGEVVEDNNSMDASASTDESSQADGLTADTLAGNAADNIEAEKGAENEVAIYDFAHPSHKLNSRLPVLEVINEKIAEQFALSLSAQFHQSIGVTASVPIFEKFKAYAAGLPDNINIDQFSMEPLQGNTLFILQGDLAYMLVDSFFGGGSGAREETTTHRFTPTEERIIEYLRKNLIQAMIVAWDSILKIEPEFQTVLSRSQITSPANPAAVVVCNKFEIELKAGKGECHIVIPFSMLEPIRDKLTNNLQKVYDHSAQWLQKFTQRVMQSEIDIHGVFAESKISVKQLVNLKDGDFIPLGKVQAVKFSAGTTPLFDASVGVTNGLVSASIIKWHEGKK